MSNGGSGKAVVVVETQWDCGNAMMGFETQCGSGGRWWTIHGVGVEAMVPK